MADEVIRRQGSATDHQSFTGAAGELTVDNTNWNLRIHDGSTAGGHTTVMVSDFGGPAASEVGKGAIVESGTNANGSYVRWENGGQVQIGVFVFDFTDETIQGVNLPSDWVEVQSSCFSPENDDVDGTTDGLIHLVFMRLATASIRMQIRYEDSTAANPGGTVTCNMRWFAWGTWK